MSRPTASAAPAARPSARAPTAPPAGPESTVHEPCARGRAGARHASAREHHLGLRQAGVARALGQPLQVAAQQRGEGGVDHGRRAALVLAEHAGGLVRRGHVDARRPPPRAAPPRAARARDGGSPTAGRPRPPRASQPVERRAAARPRRARAARRPGPSARAPRSRSSAGTSGGGWPAHSRYSSARAWRPSSSRSVKPSVASSAVRATRPSSSAFVPTVIPWTKRSTSRAEAPAPSSASSTAAITPSDWSSRRGRRLAGDEPVAGEQGGVGEGAADVHPEDHGVDATALRASGGRDLELFVEMLVRRAVLAARQRHARHGVPAARARVAAHRAAVERGARLAAGVSTNSVASVMCRSQTR